MCIKFGGKSIGPLPPCPDHIFKCHIFESLWQRWNIFEPLPALLQRHCYKGNLSTDTHTDSKGGNNNTSALSQLANTFILYIFNNGKSGFLIIATCKEFKPFIPGVQDWPWMSRPEQYLSCGWKPDNVFSSREREVFETSCNASSDKHRLMSFDCVCMLHSPPSSEEEYVMEIYHYKNWQN